MTTIIKHRGRLSPVWSKTYYFLEYDNHSDHLECLEGLEHLGNTEIKKQLKSGHCLNFGHPPSHLGIQGAVFFFKM